ncbi:MAG: hypothetical protein HZC25_13985 [Rhodospirillales bacterium]|nr:hypothetical protein [Rhodospirillales bacterium]
MTIGQTIKKAVIKGQILIQGCLTKLLLFGIGFTGIVSLVIAYFMYQEDRAFFQNLGKPMSIGPPCEDRVNNNFGAMKPSALTFEAQQLLSLWPRKLWPLSYYFRVEDGVLTAPQFVYQAFREELFHQTRLDIMELYRLAGREPEINFEKNSWQCRDYARIGTRDGLVGGHSAPWTYYSITRDDPEIIRAKIDRFLPKDFKRILFEDRIDPFTGQPLPPPPDAPP